MPSLHEVTVTARVLFEPLDISEALGRLGEQIFNHVDHYSHDEDLLDFDTLDSVVPVSIDFRELLSLRLQELIGTAVTKMTFLVRVLNLTEMSASTESAAARSDEPPFVLIRSLIEAQAPLHVAIDKLPQDEARLTE